MSVQALLQKYQNTPRLFQLADRLSFSHPQKIALKNLYGSSTQFVIAATFLHPSCSQLNHLIVLNDAEEAAYFHNTLENLTGALDLFYFPSSFKNSKNFRLLNSSHVMLRIEALMKIALGGDKKIIVTYPEALHEKVTLPDRLSSNIIYIKTADTLDVGKLLLQLTNYGFERTDFVYEPGQFAIRGGILDIYSFGNDKPYRIELFGNEVDSIRIIDPETQLSERKLLQVSIIPNVDILPTIGIGNEERVSLFDFLPENTILWMQDTEFCKERLSDETNDLKAFIQSQNKNENSTDTNEDRLEKRNITENDFISIEDIEKKIIKRHVVEFGYRSSRGLL